MASVTVYAEYCDVRLQLVSCPICGTVCTNSSIFKTVLCHSSEWHLEDSCVIVFLNTTLLCSMLFHVDYHSAFKRSVARKKRKISCLGGGLARHAVYKVTDMALVPLEPSSGSNTLLMNQLGLKPCPKHHGGISSNQKHLCHIPGVNVIKLFVTVSFTPETSIHNTPISL